MKVSPFIKYTSPEAIQIEEPWDVVLLETENFLVVPTRGAIIEGWVLIVPKTYVLSFGDLDHAMYEEREWVQATVYNVVRETYGSVMAFEHGPSVPSQPIGCGVDHAHLHVMPEVCDLRAGADSLLPGIRWESATGIGDAAKYAHWGTDYLYCEQCNGCSWFGIHPGIPSQLFRRVVAAALGKPEHYDWRSYPEEANAERTGRALCRMEFRKREPMIASFE